MDQQNLAEYQYRELEEAARQLEKLKEESYEIIGRHENLKKRIDNVLTYWRNTLKTRLSEEFIKEFPKVRWPKVPINNPIISKGSSYGPPQSVIEKFKLYIRILIILSSTENESKRQEPSRTICYPMRLLLEPVKERCIYHFMTSPKTHVLERPEWYMELAIKWIDENSAFIQDVVDPIVGQYPQFSGANIQFVMGMIELVGMRLEEDMSKVFEGLSDKEDVCRYDQSNKIFIQIYSQLMIFLREIRALIGDAEYFKLDRPYDLLGILFKYNSFAGKILNLERGQASELFDFIISSDTCWKTLLSEEYDDQYKITECADRFMLMIQSTSERLECFRDVYCQTQLIELLIDLFEKFLEELKGNRIRSRSAKFVNELLTLNYSNGIEGVRKELRHPFFCIMNNVYFLYVVLHERTYLASHIIDNIKDNKPSLIETLGNVEKKYKDLYHSMIETALNIYDETECDLNSYLDFVRPQIPKSTFDHIEDEARKIYQEKRTRELFMRKMEHRPQ